MSAEEEQVLLFAYGTLRQHNVQLALFGRTLDGHPDALVGYRLGPLRITDAGVIATSGTDQHTVARETSQPEDRIPGVVFGLTPEELALADAYEVAECRRVTTQLASGTKAFVYVGAQL